MAETARAWIVGGETAAIVVDPGADHEQIARDLGDRELMAIVCTHAHEAHAGAAVALADLCDAPILLHPADAALWSALFPEREPDGPLLQGERLEAGGIELEVLHTPGHTPGSVCLSVPAQAAVYTGDTLLRGRAEAEESEGLRALAALPSQTAVRPGHGPETTIGDEAAALAAAEPVAPAR
ncbi:MBL fold metallo-hydrolase [Nocardiopsis coralliicola]